jgi:hypothetical protein
MLAKIIRFDGDPILTWMMSNVVAHHHSNESVTPRKESSEKKTTACRRCSWLSTELNVRSRSRTIAMGCGSYSRQHLDDEPKYRLVIVTLGKRQPHSSERSSVMLTSNSQYPVVAILKR